MVCGGVRWCAVVCGGGLRCFHADRIHAVVHAYVNPDVNYVCQQFAFEFGRRFVTIADVCRPTPRICQILPVVVEGWEALIR